MMKKFIAILLVVATMILCLTACGGKKATAVITFDDDASVTALPIHGIKNISAQVQFNVMTVNMGNEGEYTLPIVVDGNTYNIVLTNENGNVTAAPIEGLNFTIK